MAKQIIMSFDVGGAMHVDVDGVKGEECKTLTQGILAEFSTSETTDSNDKPDLHEAEAEMETADRGW